MKSRPIGTLLAAALLCASACSSSNSKSPGSSGPDAGSGPDTGGSASDGGSVAPGTDGAVAGGADAAAGDAALADAGVFVHAPRILSIIPQVLVAGGTVYIGGTDFGRMDDKTRVTVTVRPLSGSGDDGGVDAGAPADGGASTVSTLPLHIVAMTPTTITATLGLDLGGVTGRVVLSVTTPAGAVTSTQTLSVIMGDTGFGGATTPGSGLIGTVYQLQPNTSVLPNFAMACSDPSVVNAPPASPCPFSSILVPNLDVPDRSFTEGFPGLQSDLVEWFAIEFAGLVHIANPGFYVFQTCSDDGSKVFIDGVLVVNNDGVHGTNCVSGPVTLTAGDHPVVVDYFQGPRYSISLQLFWTPPNGTSQLVPTSSLSVSLH